MRSSSSLFSIFTAVLLTTAAAAQAAHVDMKDPRRALGREDDVRVDAELLQETISASSPISVTYQVQNLSKGVIAIADKCASADFDRDSRTITLSIGAEVPTNGMMPHMVLIAPGEKKTFSAAAIAHVAAPESRTPFAAVPRYVQVKVNFLRDVAPFHELIAHQEQVAAAQPRPSQTLSDAQFDAWLQSNDSVLLNSLPVDWKSGGSSKTPSADQASPDTPLATAGGSWD